MILFPFILFLVISEMINDVWIFEQKKVIHDICAAVATTPVQTKGQLISKGLFKVIICTKKRTKIFSYFCPSL